MLSVWVCCDCVCWCRLNVLMGEVGFLCVLLGL